MSITSSEHEHQSDPSLPVAVVTGASSGIGLETAKALAEKGWRVIAIGRNPERCAKAERELRAVARGSKVDMLVVDLSLLAAAAKAAKDIAAMTDRIDVLVNNAGGMASEKVMTKEGYEASFAANHLGPFVLTLRLLPLLRRAANDAEPGSVRIINTASDGSEMIPTLNLDDMQNLDNYSNGLAYCSGKLANVLFARALAKRLQGDGICAYSVHPGTVDSNFFSHTDQTVQDAYRDAEKLTPAQGADTLIWLATASEPGKSSGGYYYQRVLREPNPVVNDDDFVERFWRASEQLVAKAGF